MVTTTTTPTPTKVDVQKGRVASSLVEKNTAASSLIKLQKEHLAMEVYQMLDKHQAKLSPLRRKEGTHHHLVILENRVDQEHLDTPLLVIVLS